MTLLIATRNAHKVQEIRAILSGRFRYLTLVDFPEAPSPAETADTFEGNATIKAVELARWIVNNSKQLEKAGITNGRVFVLGDDSGLEVDALNGGPGVYSARFAALDSGAAGNSPDSQNNAKLLRLMKDVPSEKRTARFRCVLALALVRESGEEVLTFSGSCEGRIACLPAGQGGFGYDPLFIPDGYQQSYAELGETIKNKLSHRAQALAKLREYLQTKHL